MDRGDLLAAAHRLRPAVDDGVVRGKRGRGDEECDHEQSLAHEVLAFFDSTTEILQ
jgi:hypothetical protein